MIREQVLDHWLKGIFKNSDFKRIMLAGDASFRRYYRIFVEDCSYVVMDAPPPEVPEIFVNIARILTNVGVSVPSVIASELEQGFLLLSDLGDRLYLPELNEYSADILYKDAFQALVKIQKCQAEVPVFDHAFLKRQFGIFQEWFLGKHIGISNMENINNNIGRTETPSTVQKILDPLYEKISETILHQPQVFVHRDFHSRNLMILDNKNPGVIDFQDAMMGPITYDLVSLLQDCYISWPRERVVEWVKDFQYRAQAIGLLSHQESLAEIMRWFDWTGLQRHLKNLGIFARLNYRDGKSQYLQDIPRVLDYIKETSLRYAELNPLWAFFESIQISETVEA
jgi:hypothetical protein